MSDKYLKRAIIALNALEESGAATPQQLVEYNLQVALLKRDKRSRKVWEEQAELQREGIGTTERYGQILAEAVETLGKTLAIVSGPKDEEGLSREDYKDAYTVWYDKGQKMHSVLLRLWRMVTPDSEYAVFKDPEDVFEAFSQLKRNGRLIA